MVSTNEFRKGGKIEYKGEPVEIVDFQHVKMGRGGAIIRTKMKSLRTGSVLEDTFRSGEKFETPQLDEREMQYLYAEGEMHFFMDTESYEQIPFTEAQLGDVKKFLKENMTVKVLNYRGKPLTVELPTFVELAVARTDPGYKGDTASGGSKPATLETGAVVKVPFHINEGDVLKIDTRTSEYIERVK
ncbi:MAG TPA: elongation factor P [Thermodesulfovibrionales bacterium]|nr:elongation factor P [Thermodesulfovibrionales bacterium]